MSSMSGDLAVFSGAEWPNLPFQSTKNARPRDSLTIETVGWIRQRELRSTYSSHGILHRYGMLCQWLPAKSPNPRAQASRRPAEHGRPEDGGVP